MRVKTIDMDATVKFPQIPETATEEYLEKLEEKIRPRLESATPIVAARLHAMLEEVYRRRQQLQDEAATFVEDVTSSVSPDDPIGTLATDVLNEEEQQQVKARLQKILDDVKQQRADSPYETRTFVPPQSRADSEEGTSPFHAGADSLTDQEFLLVKDRMKDMLSEVQQQRQQTPEDIDEDIFELDESNEFSEGEFELSEDLEVNPADRPPLPEESEFVLGENFEVVEEIKKERVDEKQPERTQKFDVTDEEYLEFQERFRTLKQQIEVTAEEKSGELTFEGACRRVSKGESLVLLEKVGLSEREQLMLWAFHEFMHQMKGVKRQQSYDMQHLTARSIKELEQIFKTYQIQGYLRAELNTIYNRLLNLRGRFSILH